MSYRSPQYIKDKSVDVAIKQTDAAKARMDQVDDERSAMLEENVSSVVQGAVNAMTQQKEGLKDLNKSVTRNQINMYKRVGGEDFDTGFSDYDQQAETLFYDAITKYNEINAHLENNTLIDSEAGKKDLAKIENMIDVYGQSVPNIIAVARAIEEQSRPGADGFSATGAPAWQLDMIRKIVNKDGNVQIKQENGNLYLYDPDAKYQEEGEDGKMIDKKGGILDLVQFNKMLVDKDNSYLKYKVNAEPAEEAAYKTFMYKDNKLKDDVSSDGKMTKEQQQNYMNGVTGIGSFAKDKKTGHYKGYPPSQFETILDEAGDSYWVDIMGKDEPWNYGKYSEGTDEYDKFIEEQYKPALNQLAQESLENNNDGIEPENGNWFWDESTDDSDTDETSKNNEDLNVESIKVDDKLEVADNKKGVNEALKIDVGDGNDYIRKMFNYENTSGSSSSGGVDNYGFTGTGSKGAALKKLYDKAEGTSEEKGIKVVNDYIIGTSPNQKKGDYGTTILTDLGIDREAYDGLDDSIKEQLVDWKFNTGRGSADLIAIASGIEIDGEKWDGKKAFKDNSPTPDQVKNVDYSKLTPKALYDARQELYIKRIQGMEEMLKKDPNNKKLKSDLEFARDGYNNSQINRFKVKEKTNEELVADFED